MAATPQTGEEVTALLRAWRSGGADAEQRLLELVYATLRRIAAAQLRRERSEHTLQPTALVHEAYLRLIGQRQLDWRDRAHFFGLAAVTMRRVLVDHARRRQAKRRDPEQQVEGVRLETEAGETVELLDLDRALDRFATRFPRQAKVVEMRYFAGLGFEEIGVALDLSLRTIRRDWDFARAWLYDALSDPR